MKVVFMGTPQLAADILARTAEEHEVAGVLTRPDAVRGRGRELVASPVKRTALARGIEVFTPSDLRGDETFHLIRDLAPDIICVAAYGALLPKRILDIPRFGCVNVHTSLLPRWRGAAPIERAILACDETTGACVMRMEEGLDTGPYCIRREVEIGGMYLDDLARTLAAVGADALMEALPEIEAGRATWTEQGEDGIVYAEKVGKSELICDPADSAQFIVAKVRASSASRPARMEVAGRTLAVERASFVEEGPLSQAVGQLGAGRATFVQKRLVIGAADGLVELEQVKPDGKKSMDARSFAAGVQGIRGAQVAWGRA